MTLPKKIKQSKAKLIKQITQEVTKNVTQRENERKLYDSYVELEEDLLRKDWIF